MTWTWPVSGTAFKCVCEERDHWRSLYEGLLVMYHGQVAEQRGLIRDGFHPAPPAPPEGEAEATALPAPMLAAIETRGIDREMRRDMEQWARQQLARGATLEAVTHGLWDGQDGTPV